MEAAGNDLCADLTLEIPGLKQYFYLYRERCGRQISCLDDGGYRSTYEAVYCSEPEWQNRRIGSRAMTKLIFNSTSQQEAQPLPVAEMLAAIPEDMLQYLVRLLNDRWAVVTFNNDGNETVFTVNLDHSELWEQEEANWNAIFFAMEEELKTLGPYITVKNGTADPVPGSSTDGYPSPHVGVFWIMEGEKIVSVKEPWDAQHAPSAEVFDHRAQWEKLPGEVTRGEPFDRYPRGQVEIRNGQVTVYSHHSLIHNPYPWMISAEFGIPLGSSRFLAYGYPKEYADQIYSHR